MSVAITTNTLAEALRNLDLRDKVDAAALFRELEKISRWRTDVVTEEANESMNTTAGPYTMHPPEGAADVRSSRPSGDDIEKEPRLFEKYKKDLRDDRPLPRSELPTERS